MGIEQPQSTDKLNSPDHSLMHRIMGVDLDASVQSLTVDSDGVTNTNGRIRNLVIKTDTYTILKGDEIIICNKGTAMTINLPLATGSGRIFDIKNIGAGTVTIDGNTTDEIDGQTTQEINQWDSIKIVDYASNNWVII